MCTKVFKIFVETCLLSIQLLIYSSAFAKSGGSMDGGGGDAAEIRVNEIRSDILKWINDGGALGLKLPNEFSYGEYVYRMTDILKAQKVVIGFIEKDDKNNDELKVLVNGTPKTCRGFISAINSRPHILCNISRFEKTSASEQYKLIHHEYAGLVNIENNEGAASDYIVSSQITDFLSQQTVLKLAVKKASSDVNLEETSISSSYKYSGSNENRLCYVTYSLNTEGEIETHIDHKCYAGGKISISFNGNFLANSIKGQLTSIALSIQLNNSQIQTYSPSIGWGSSWGANQTINLPSNASTIKIYGRAINGKIAIDLKELHLDIVDLYHLPAFVAFTLEKNGPLIKNDKNICSGNDIILFYDLKRMVQKEIHSPNGDGQFPGWYDGIIEQYNQNDVLIDSLNFVSGFSVEDQYHSFTVKSSEVSYLKFKFTGHNFFSGSLDMAHDPELENVFYKVNCRK
jgi:hypothetical protein